jgi:hypothetical protein
LQQVLPSEGMHQSESHSFLSAAQVSPDLVVLLPPLLLDPPPLLLLPPPLLLDPPPLLLLPPPLLLLPPPPLLLLPPPPLLLLPPEPGRQALSPQVSPASQYPVAPQHTAPLGMHLDVGMTCQRRSGQGQIRWIEVTTYPPPQSSLPDSHSAMPEQISPV